MYRFLLRTRGNAGRGAVAALTVLLVLSSGSRVRASYVSTVTASNPTSYYRLEETSGTTAADLGSKNLSATYANVTLNQPGIPGGDATDRAALFNGTSSSLTVAGTYGAVTFPLTIEAFFKTTSSSANQKVAG